MKRRKISCYGLLLALFTIFWLSLNVYSDVSAVTKDYQSFSMRVRYSGGSSYVSTGSLSYNEVVHSVLYVDQVNAFVSSLGSVPANTQYMTVTAKWNLVAVSQNRQQSGLPYNNSSDPSIYAVVLNGSSVNFQNSSLTVYTTDWECTHPSTGVSTWCRTFTYKPSFIVPSSQLPSTISSAGIGIEYPGRLQTDYAFTEYYFEGTSTNRLVAEFNTDLNSALLAQMNQLQSLTNDALGDINESITDTYNYLTDDTAPNVNTSSIGNSAGWLPAGPVDSILTLPVTFIQSILSVFNNDSCQPVVLPLPYMDNQNLTLPCMRPLLNEMGFLTIYEVVGSVISMFVIYRTLLWLYKFVDDTLTFRENNDFGGM